MSGTADQRLVRLAAGVWRSPPLVVADTTWLRLRGIRSAGEDHGVLLWTRSIHSFGLTRPLLVVVLSAAGVVASVHRLAPKRVLLLSQPGWVAETREVVDPPRRGDKARLERLASEPRA